MSQYAHTFNPINSTSFVEKVPEGFWDGHSQITLDYLLNKAVSLDLSELSELSDEFDPDVRNKQREYTSNHRISSMAERVNNIISEIPVEQHVSLQPEVFQALQEWEGYVLNVGEDIFTARLIDESNKGGIDEEGDFLIEDLRKDDTKLLKPGAVFRWVIGYVIKKGGAKRRSSDIVFRRLPQWTQRDMDEADKKADELLGAIDWQ